MNILKKSFTVICCLSIIVFSGLNVFALPDTSDWESHDLHGSNSGFANGTVKYEYINSSNRIHFVFFLSYKNGDPDSFDNAGVVININELGDIKITDVVEDYNDDVYYAELVERFADPYSKSMSLEVNVDLKNGLSSQNKLSMYVLDLQGVRSNQFDFDISNTVTTTTSKSTTTKSPKAKTPTTTKSGKTSKTKASKTTKEKTSRTTKEKTSKTKTEKYVSETLVEQTQEFVTTQNIKINEKISEKSENNRKVILIFGATMAIIAVISGCAIGIRNKKRDNSGV